MGVRWDAVVDKSGFWAGPSRPEAAASAVLAPVSVELWLFGTLAGTVPERPLTLRFGGPVRVDDVLAALGRRCGSEFLDKVISPGGSLVKHCRVFINGEPAEDPAAWVGAEPSPARIEMILLTAAEGG